MEFTLVGTRKGLWIMSRVWIDVFHSVYNSCWIISFDKLKSVGGEKMFCDKGTSITILLRTVPWSHQCQRTNWAEKFTREWWVEGFWFRFLIKFARSHCKMILWNTNCLAMTPFFNSSHVFVLSVSTRSSTTYLTYRTYYYEMIQMKWDLVTAKWLSKKTEERLIQVTCRKSILPPVSCSCSHTVANNLLFHWP